MNENDIRLLVRTLEIPDYENMEGERFYKRKTMAYLEGKTLSGTFGTGSVIAVCGIFPFDKERAGFSYISSLSLKRVGEVYVVTSILR